MVKFDAERDYYADLELPASCTNEDVRKQFRRLALKCHPDRHPGDEVVWNSRFQDVSAAHEVLGDPDERRRYDQARRQTPMRAASARASAPRGNPYQARSDFPPPKMRTQPPPRPATSGPTKAGGADRYTKFPGPPPPPRDNPNTSKDARERANVFNAWQSTFNQQSQRGPAGPDTRRPDGHFTPDTPRSANSSAQRSAWDEMNKQPQSSPQTGYTRPPPPPPPPRPQPPFQPQAPTAKKVDPPGSFRRQSGEDAPFTEGERVRTPYASNVGEKTYFSTDAMPRSASTKDSTKPRSETNKDSSGAGEDLPDQNTNEGQRKSKPFAMYSSSSSESSTDVSTRSFRRAERSQDKSSASRPMARPSGSWTNRGGQGKPDGPSQTPEQKHEDVPIFTFPVNEETFVRTSDQTRFPSAPVLNTTFSSGGPPNFFSSPVTASAPGFTSKPSSGESLPIRDRGPGIVTNDLHPQEPAENPPSASGQGKFSPNGWTRELQAENWASQWAFPPTSGVSSSRNNSSPKRTRPASSRTPVGSGSRGHSGTDADQSERQEVPFGPTAFPTQRRVSHDSNAMDLDPEPPSAADRYSQEQQSAAQAPPRQTFVQPQRPSASEDVERRASYPNIPGPPPGPPPAGGRRVSTSMDLNDLRNVPPLSGGTSGGIGSMGDLSANLPFPSQAATTPPTAMRRPSAASRVELPKPPKAPFKPQNLSQDQWAAYIARLAVYNVTWNTFNMEMIKKLQGSAERFEQMDKGPEGGMLSDWLGAVGETQLLGGWEVYRSHMREDERIRTYWTVAWEKHMEVMDSHEKLRARLIRNGVAL